LLTTLLRWVRILVMTAGGLLLIVTFTPLVPWAARHLSSDWTCKENAVMIVLSGPTVADPGLSPRHTAGLNTYWRAIHAIYLWRQGHYRNIVLSGAWAAESIQPLLVANGVPESAILVENRATSTRENALFLKPILQSLSGPFVLVTSDYHVYRAKRCFARENITVATMPAPDLLKTCSAPIARWQGFWTLLEELTKIGYYRSRGWI